MNNSTIRVYNDFHLGDNIFNFIMFYHIKDYIEKNNIKIEYFCKKEYYDQVKEFNCSENIKLSTIEENEKKDLGLQLWIGNKNFEINNYNYLDGNRGVHHLDDFLLLFYNQFLKLNDIDVKINDFEYEDPDLLERYKKITNATHDKYSDLDFLIINSVSHSAQYNEETTWNELINKLNKSKKIVTTEKIDGIPCTRDDKLSIKDIAAISTRSKKIIMVNSGVSPGIFNKYTLNNAEVIYYFDKNNSYKHEKLLDVKNIENLYFLADETEGFSIMNNQLSYYTFSNYNNLLYFLIPLLLITLLCFLYFRKYRVFRYFRFTPMKI
jgi:hypothetical protein